MTHEQLTAVLEPDLVAHRVRLHDVRDPARCRPVGIGLVLLGNGVPSGRLLLDEVWWTAGTLTLELVLRGAAVPSTFPVRAALAGRAPLECTWATSEDGSIGIGQAVFSAPPAVRSAAPTPPVLLTVRDHLSAEPLVQVGLDLTGATPDIAAGRLRALFSRL